MIDTGTEGRVAEADMPIKAKQLDSNVWNLQQKTWMMVVPESSKEGYAKHRKPRLSREMGWALRASIEISSGEMWSIGFQLGWRRRQ